VTARFRNYARLNARAPGEETRVSFDAAAARLGEILLGDIADMIRRSSVIHAALDASLAGAPFETLACPGEDAPLLGSHDVVRVPGAAFLRYLRARAAPAPASSSLLAVASGTPDLEGARREVRHLASRYGAASALDPQREEFFAGLSRFDAIHVASHVHVDSERPWHSGIQIRPGVAPHARVAQTDGDRAAEPLSLSASDSSEIAGGLPVDPFVRASDFQPARCGAAGGASA
jgi:hypothetical protein